MMAESKGLILRGYRCFWMGHKGDIENRYTTNKQRLIEAVVEDVRAAYARGEEFLQTKERVLTSEDKLRESFREQLLLVARFSSSDIEEMDVPSISDERLQEIVRRKLLGVQTYGSVKQKAVRISEVARYLAPGWEYVANLPDK